MAKVHRQVDPARDDIDGARGNRDLPDGRASFGIAETDPVDEIDQFSERGNRVAPHSHRHRACMCLFPAYADFVPADALPSVHDADLTPGSFQDRALLDMQFEIAI